MSGGLNNLVGVSAVSVSEQGRSLKCDHGLRRTAIVESLLSDVLHGRLRPGHHLVTKALADRFGVSHTPIREALIALAGVGIVDLLPNRGAIVRRLTPRDLHEMCQVRRALECEAVRNACGRIDLGVLRALRADLRRLNCANAPSRPGFIEKARDVDIRLHDAIEASSENLFLMHELGRLKILFRTFRDASRELVQARYSRRRVVQDVREHLAIVEALLAGDRGEAVVAMSRHVMASRKYWSRAMAAGASGHSPRRPEDGTG
jgi:DNA-binding GntR family transcriptional regulator